MITIFKNSNLHHTAYSLDNYKNWYLRYDRIITGNFIMSDSYEFYKWWDIFIKKQLMPAQLPAKCKLFFMKECDFPRSQISDNPNVKRVIKSENADLIVIPDKWKDTRKYDNITAYGNQIKIDQNNITYKDVYQSDVKNDPNFLSDGSFSRETKIVIQLINSQNFDLLADIIEGRKTNLITVSCLQKLLAGSLGEIDDSVLDSIYNLLITKNKTNVDLAYKCIMQYNVNDHLCKIANMLYRVWNDAPKNTYYIYNRSEFYPNSVYCDAFYKAIDINPRYINSWDNSYKFMEKLIPKTSKEDGKIGIKLIHNYLEDTIAKEKANFESKWNDLGFKVDLNYEAIWED